jgi:hypothetical protein
VGLPSSAIRELIMSPDTAPITLQEACDEIFRGVLSVSTLRTAGARGELAVFKIGRRCFTTRAHVQEWIESCRLRPEKKVSATPEAPRAPDTNRIRASQEAFLETLEQLRETRRKS